VSTIGLRSENVENVNGCPRNQLLLRVGTGAKKLSRADAGAKSKHVGTGESVQTI